MVPGDRMPSAIVGRAGSIINGSRDQVAARSSWKDGASRSVGTAALTVRRATVRVAE